MRYRYFYNLPSLNKETDFERSGSLPKVTPVARNGVVILSLRLQNWCFYRFYCCLVHCLVYNSAWWNIHFFKPITIKLQCLENDLFFLLPLPTKVNGWTTFLTLPRCSSLLYAVLFHFTLSVLWCNNRLRIYCLSSVGCSLGQIPHLHCLCVLGAEHNVCNIQQVVNKWKEWSKLWREAFSFLKNEESLLPFNV